MKEERTTLKRKVTILEKKSPGEPIEVIKEIKVPVEVIKEVEVINLVENKEKQEKLQQTISTLQENIRTQSEKISKMENLISELEKIKGPIKGQFMGSSNINDSLYR